MANGDVHVCRDGNAFNGGIAVKRFHGCSTVSRFRCYVEGSDKPVIQILGYGVGFDARKKYAEEKFRQLISPHQV